MTAAEERAALVGRVVRAMCSTLEFCAGMAFGVPVDAREQYATALAEASVSVLGQEFAKIAQELADARAEAADERAAATALSGDLTRMHTKLTGALAQALDGWERAVDREHAANCFDEHDPEQCRPPRIAEIRREAGL